VYVKKLNCLNEIWSVNNKIDDIYLKLFYVYCIFLAENKIFLLLKDALFLEKLNIM